MIIRKILFAILIMVSLNSIAAINVKTYIPTKALVYVPMLKQEQLKIWPGHPKPEVLAGLSEQESCISLTHSKCWDPRSRLKTSREEGAGIGQITKAYTKNGAIRFDALAELRAKHHSDLKELSWSNVYQRADLQLRALVLKNLDNYKNLYYIKDSISRLAFADAAYNGGYGGVIKDRMACGLKEDCDPQFWFNNVEFTCMKSKKPIYGNRSACDINREHVQNVMNVRSNKYKDMMSR